MSSVCSITIHEWTRSPGARSPAWTGFPQSGTRAFLDSNVQMFAIQASAAPSLWCHAAICSYKYDPQLPLNQENSTAVS